MPRQKTVTIALSIGQLAKRWSVAENRIRELIDAGQLSGAFKIPSAGRYGETIKIPLDSILRAECDWAVTPSTPESPPRRRRNVRNSAAFKHFPELIDDHEPDAGCREDDQD